MDPSGAATMVDFDPLQETLGPLVDTTPALMPNNTVPICGRFVLLRDLRQSDMRALWRHLEIPLHPDLFDYLPWPVPASPDELWQFLQRARIDRNFVFYAVCAQPERLNRDPNTYADERRKEPMGIIAYLNVSLENRELEIGAVLFSKALQRTIAATETFHLMLKNAFQVPYGPSYRRVCWKCNRLNRPSRRAAERIGFVYEGTFRNHMIVRGRSRDSDWLSILEHEWLLVDAAICRWMADDNFNSQRRQITKLEDLRT